MADTSPTELLTRHLSDLQETGMTVLEDVISEDTIEQLKSRIAEKRLARHADESPADGHFWIMDGLLWSPELADAVTHPAALWLIQQYMNTSAIHYCHQPIITTLKPAREMTGTFPEGGWHSDYPYHPGVFPDEYWPPDQVFGVQFNICLDAFTPSSAGTQYVPGSHRTGHWPPDELNNNGTRMGEGVHQNVRQMEAAAGAAIIYDARIWHRACVELNQSGRDRIAILNAVAPAWVPPMIDKSPIAEKFRGSDVQQQLSDRTAREIDRLCNSPTMTTPAKVPQLQPRPPFKKSV